MQTGVMISHRAQRPSQPRRTVTAYIRRQWDLAAWAFLLLALNLAVFRGETNTSLIFLPQAVRDGQWWRVLTFPLVHLSWYHLLLDGGAFLLLYKGLEEKGWLKRSILLAVCSASSLLAGLWLANGLTSGLCGLSGVAHALMAFSGLEMARTASGRRWGLVCLATVVGKSVYEIITGRVAFAFMHMGLCGLPVAACHAGGVFGAVILYALFRFLDRGHDARKAQEKKR